MESGPLPDVSSPEQSPINPLPGPDKKPIDAQFGDVINDVNMTYVRGDVVNVVFQGANPRHNMKVNFSSSS